MKTVADKDIVVSSVIYNSVSKPLENAIVESGQLQLRLHTHDKRNRATSFEIRDGANRLAAQITTTHDANGKASSRTTAFSTDGALVEIPIK